MSVKNLDNYSVTIARGLRQTDNEIALRRGDAISLNVIGVGNHAYFTLRDRIKSEVVRYNHIADWDATDPTTVMVPVVRDVVGLGRRSFAYGTCLQGEITSLFVNDRITEVTGG